MGTWQVGVDVGGTNTDLLFLDHDSGRFNVAKVPTTPHDQSDAVMNGLGTGECEIADLLAIVHGTTIATNAVLERKGSRCGLITTRGFRDVLELGRRTRPNNYGLIGTFEALIDRELRFEVSERIDARGRIVQPLNEAEVTAARKKLSEAGAETVVIHFLHAYANPEHESRAAEIARNQWPNEYISVSSEILREVREFERGTTAAVNAFVQPVVASYLNRLLTRLQVSRYDRELLVMQGNGGTLNASAAARQPVHTVMSGPAAGAVAAARIGAQAGFENLIACDMGGTSFDVSLILGGAPALSAEKDLAYGVPVHVPMVDIHTIGAGGGSIARVDAAGLLRVGPESAGAEPGPVCYGRGGERPTVTDANLLLGRVDPSGFAGVGDASGTEKVANAVGVTVGAALSLSPVDAAAAVLAVAGNQLASAIRLVSIEQGHDPRDFVLFAFGGAGPLHAVELARELGIPKVLVPRFPGITSALGCLLSNLRHDYVHSLWRPLAEIDPLDADAILAEQADRGRRAIASDAVPIEGIKVIHEADLMYRGQSHVFRVPVQSPAFTIDDVNAVFAEHYAKRFEIGLSEMTPVLASLRTTVVGQRADVDLAMFGGGETEATRETRRQVYFDGDWLDTPVVARQSLSTGATIDGPVIIEQPDTTCVINPGARATVDSAGNLLIDLDPTT